MHELEIYKAVNICETLEELSEVILEIGNSQVIPFMQGRIQGRYKDYKTSRMSYGCLNQGQPGFDLTLLTRNYGIRQQALYILNKNGKIKFSSPHI
jgi:hypothetical protein